MSTMSEALPSAAPMDGLRARQIVEGLGDGFLSYDADWRITDCNRGAQRLLQRTRQELLGRTLWEICELGPESSLGALHRRVAATGAAEEAEIVDVVAGEERVFSAQVFPLGDGTGAVFRDTTEIRIAERRLAESEARYRELADGTPALAWMSGADGELEFVNQAMADALGRTRADLLGEGWTEAIDPEERTRMLQGREEAHRAQSAFLSEGRFRRPDGSLRIIQLYGRPRFDATGAYLGHVGMAVDMTDTRAAEQRQKLLIDELNHRVKNTLMTVQSLARQTLREAGVPRAVEDSLTDRLVALSAAHDVLAREKWASAELADLAREALEAIVVAHRIAIAGPHVRIAPDVAVPLSMALHELAVNALKHGALSNETGTVRLSWARSNAGVALEWREMGGPPVSAPLRAGFGARLLERGLAAELGEPAQLIYAPEGLICRMRAPAVAGGGAARAAAASSP